MAKAKGKEKSAASNASGEVEATAGDEVMAEPTPSEPMKMDEATGTTVDAGCDEPDEAKEELEEEEAEESEEEEEVEVKEELTVETEIVTVVESEKMEEVDKKEEVKGEEKVEGASTKKAKRRRAKKKAAGASAAASNDTNKPETPAENKAKNKADAMGLIFMCSAKTKKDCYQYNVLGLPENKKDLVTKVYKGMRLFLYDIDLKLMYGIYRASSPGGYNLEPKAFNSAFPCQVRFTVLNECNPLPEEKFKAAIKSNYFGKSKFNIQLSQEQVNNLCKLFTSGGKGSSKQNRADGSSKTPVSAGRDRKRGPPPQTARRTTERKYPRGGAHHPAYARQPAYISPPPARAMLMPPPPPQSYYAGDEYYYRRGEPSREMRPPAFEYRDPYSMYMEPPPPAPYREAGGYPAGGMPPPAYAPPPPQYRYY